MKKANWLTFLLLCFVTVAVILFAFLGKARPSNAGASPENSLPQAQNYIPAPSASQTSESGGKTGVSENKTPASKPADLSMKDTLFIGDSRTVGLMEYGEIENAHFFCSVGMSVYNIHQKPVSVPGVGKVTLNELLDDKKYNKIYIMLGINEVGYDFDSTTEKYSQLVDLIKEKQPGAVILVQANLHVTKRHSDGDKVVNNPAIDALNTRLSGLADGKSIFYLDANPVFDDASGSLSADKSQDSTHLYAKYYQEWSRWIVEQTALLMGEG